MTLLAFRSSAQGGVIPQSGYCFAPSSSSLNPFLRLFSRHRIWVITVNSIQYILYFVKQFLKNVSAL